MSENIKSLAEQPNPLKDQLVRMFIKIANRTISREEGTLFLNDIVRRSTDKSEVQQIILDLCQKPPKDILVRTIFHTVALTKNPAFVPILEMGLKHESEDISIVAAEGLALLGSDSAKNVLAKHLTSEVYHARRASANVLIKGWGREGIRLVVGHGLSHPEEYCRYTAALSLAKSGKTGISALLDVMESNDMNAISSAGDALREVASAIEKDGIPKLFHALDRAVSKKHTNAVLSLLKLIGAMKEKAAGFEERLAVLLRYEYEPVRKAAENTLLSIATERAKELISSEGEDVLLLGEDDESEYH